MKFLIIRFSSIGDIVLTTPVVRCLKKKLPDAEIHFLTKKNYKEILCDSPYISKIHVLENDFRDMIKVLKNENFDYIIDLHHNLRTLKIKFALRKVKSFSFNKLNFEKWLLTAFKVNRLPDVHIVDRYLDTVKSFGVVNDNAGLDYYIPQKDVVPYEDLPTSHQHGFIAIAIGAAHNTKKLPYHKLKELCRKINHPIVLLGGKEDAINGGAIASADPVKIYNACGKFSLNESTDLVRKSKLLITHDTGLMHIAAALKKPIISVWGNTVPEFGMTPYFGKAEITSAKFEIKNLYCKPCSKIGYAKCPLVHFKCMELHDMNEIAHVVYSIIR